MLMGMRVYGVSRARTVVELCEPVRSGVQIDDFETEAVVRSGRIKKERSRGSGVGENK